MKLDISVLGSSRDVNLFISLVKKSFPDIQLGDIDIFPNNGYSKDPDLIALVTTLTGGDKK